MGPLEFGYTVGVTVLNIAIMIVGVVFWSRGAHLHRKTARQANNDVVHMLAVSIPPGPAEEWGGGIHRPVPPQPTPGCDCGSMNMTFGWHDNSCAWRRAYLAAYPYSAPEDDHA